MDITGTDGPSALAIRADAADEAETLALIGATQAAFGPIDLFCAIGS